MKYGLGQLKFGRFSKAMEKPVLRFLSLDGSTRWYSGGYFRFGLRLFASNACGTAVIFLCTGACSFTHQWYLRAIDFATC